RGFARIEHGCCCRAGVAKEANALSRIFAFRGTFARNPGIYLFESGLNPCFFRVSKFMSKTALLFAGQGAQVVGMGRDLAEKFPSAKAWFDRANAALGYDLTAVCFNGPDAELTKTENAQPGIFLVSWVEIGRAHV